MGFFSFLKRAPLRLQLYGKLPIAKDYLRIGFGDPAGVPWRAWLDQNFSTDLGPGERRSLSCPTGFLLGRGAQRALLGCLWNSSDAGEQRSFPFSMALSDKPKRIWRRTRSGDAFLLQALGFLEEMRGRALACENGAQLMLQLRGVEPDPSAWPPILSNHIDFDTWCARLWPASGALGLKLDLARLHAASMRPELTVLRIPLRPELDEFEQLQLWFAILQASGWARSGNWPNLFIQRHSTRAGDPGATWLLVTRRTLCEADAALLSEPAAQVCPPDELRLARSASGCGQLKPAAGGAGQANPEVHALSLLAALQRALGLGS